LAEKMLASSPSPTDRVLEVMTEAQSPMSTAQLRSRCRMRTQTMCKALSLPSYPIGAPGKGNGKHDGQELPLCSLWQRFPAERKRALRERNPPRDNREGTTQWCRGRSWANRLLQFFHSPEKSLLKMPEKIPGGIGDSVTLFRRPAINILVKLCNPDRIYLHQKKMVNA
jgi:hypothetical protein